MLTLQIKLKPDSEWTDVCHISSQAKLEKVLWWKDNHNFNLIHSARLHLKSDEQKDIDYSTVAIKINLAIQTLLNKEVNK